jgi:pimeloyl-ACP methyl ester carboxylesterase
MRQLSTALDAASMGLWRQEMLQIDGLTVRAQVGGQGPPVLLLHGWGGAIESFAPVLNDLHQSYTVIAFDLPGFGQSSLPPATWGSADYAHLTLQICERLRLDRPHLIGHSFGGQVAIQFAAAAPERLGKLVLVCSAGIRTRPALSVRLKRTAARLGKWLGTYGGGMGEKARAAIYRRVQSRDYASAGPMRPTLVRVISEDLTPLLPRIVAPTLLLWGAQDRDVPVVAGQVMARLIPTAQLTVLEHAGHFAYLDQFDRFRLLVRRFLREPEERHESPSA